MKITKSNSILRFACALLAVLTVVVSLPLFAVESKAEDETAAISHSVDFSAGTVDTALSANPTINGVTFSNFQGAPKYATNDGKTVLYGANGCFTVTTDVPDLAGTKFFVETRLNVTQLGTESLSLIALNLKTSSTATSAATPLVRLKVDETLEMRGSDSKYVSTETTMSLNNWHTVKAVVDAKVRGMLKKYDTMLPEEEEEY